MQPVCEVPVSLGMIDSAVETQHPAFAQQSDGDLITRSFLGTDINQPPGHGTAVAGMLIGRGQKLQPLLPRGTLYAASVVYSQGTYHSGATLAHLLNALNWLVQQDLQVINMSLTGPPSVSLQKAIEAIQAQGKLVVAAAGNDGPHAGPRYPAAYAGVVAATAVEPDRGIYPWANQGDHVDFAALGVSIVTARAGGQFGVESGTSMASPVIAAFLACALANSGVDSSTALELLQRQAIDLGEPGRDPVFGYGLLYPPQTSE
jgi:subtilisin family serine protease